LPFAFGRGAFLERRTNAASSSEDAALPAGEPPPLLLPLEPEPLLDIANATAFLPPSPKGTAATDDGYVV
jgi:hypothetical protein